MAETFSNATGSGSRCYGYDGRGQTTSSGLSITVDGQTTTQTATMAYNDAGAVISLTYPDGEVLSSNYDNAGYLRSLYFGDTSSSDPVSFLSGQISYTNTGQLAGLDIGGSGAKASVPTPVFSTTLGYDGIQRPISSSATLTGASTSLWSLTRTLDNVGNVLQITSTVPTTAGSSLTDTQSFCYDALNRLTWADNNGTPLGGDHCGSAPTGSTTHGYSHVYAYDAADRMISGDSGTLTYTDAAHSHAATYVSSIPNQYASYDVMGNMTCRTTDTTGGQSCAAGVQTGAQLSYDNLGRLASWTGANGLPSSEQYLYDNEGNRVLRHDSTTSGTTTTTDTITFGGLTEVSIVNGVAPSTITNYYSVAGQRVAMRKGAILSYLLPDFLGSDSIALKSDGSVQAVQLFAPYGAVRYSDQVMPTDYNFTGQRLDAQTGLIYDNARYYDPVSGRFTQADTVQTNTTGVDPYAYVGDNPESKTDPSGHFTPLIGAAVGALIGAAVGTFGEFAKHGTNFHEYNVGHILVDAGVGAVDGALIGTGVGAAVVIGTAIGGATSAIGAYISHQSFADGVQTTFEGAAIGGITSALTAGAGEEFKLGGRFIGQLTKGRGVVRAISQGTLQGVVGFVGNVGAQLWNNSRSGIETIDFGEAGWAGSFAFAGGFAGQWFYDHVPIFQTGVTYPSRVARQDQRDENWAAQSDAANIISGGSQGFIQTIQAAGSTMNDNSNGGGSSAYDGPRTRGAF